MTARPTCHLCALPVMLGALLCLTAPAAAADQMSSTHKQCELEIDAHNVAYCHLPDARGRLTCERSVGQSKPRCITANGFFADCVYQSDGSNPTAFIYCSVQNVPASDEKTKRIVITDAHFGGAKRLVRRPVGTTVESPPFQQAPSTFASSRSAAAAPSSAAVREMYQSALGDCDAARNKLLSAGVQSNNASSVIQLTPLLERACRAPAAVRMDPTYGKSYCDAVTNSLQNIALQFPAQREVLLSVTHRIMMSACSKP